ncbi:hypothetical protein BCF33_2023 [Hasllibacter halocynthiae]|uniref:Membrane protein DUF2157 n=1 Tax=Hasllibacter halocynthiae TaxID=595589 RepID=A0A2T0X2L9_9RHOB|nr:hypothetical protein [Hasllibacter halocynthiae]PRY93157.1 hypothetical protein BCF33_2023 [Hasllibacter halocynthiae]
MIERDDVKAAVAAGVLSERQAAHLAALADARRGTRDDVRPGEEPFELFRGFNEIFIVVGLVILAVGWQGLAAAVTFGTGLSDGGFARTYAVMSGLGAIVVWGLSEYFVRRRRMVAPAIALTILFALALGGATLPWLTEGVARAALGFDTSRLLMAAGIVIGGLLVHFGRFRVPFTLALIALALFGTAILAIAGTQGIVPDPEDLFLLGAQGPFAPATLALGLAFFGIAMTFDMSDPHRVTRRAANGFWLHVVAAPAIVNTVALSLLAEPSGGRLAALAGFLALMALVAVVIDRRSFLVAGAGYIVVLAGLVAEGGGVAGAVLSIGAGLLLLGALWERIRGALLRLLGPVLPVGRLPPANGVGEMA